MDRNTKSISNYIFIHDQEIVLDYINKNKFSNLEDFNWVFLGNRPVDKISNLKNLIVAKNLKYNIEHIPKLTSFTGWFALYKNDLLKSDYVNLLEYDINFGDEFINSNKKLISQDFDFIGYFPMSISDVVYVEYRQYSGTLVESINKKTNIDILDLILNLKKDTSWSSSSNSTWRTDVLKNYIDWFMNFIDDIENDIYSGHMFERSISFYYFINNLKVFLINGLMMHAQLNSHGTSPLSLDRSKRMYKTLL